MVTWSKKNFQKWDQNVRFLLEKFLLVNEKWKKISNLVEAVKFLHEDCKMCHLDIKPDNVLCKGLRKNESSETKLIDFGMVIDFSEEMG